MPNNYSRGKIYKIVCRKCGLQYFGSTTEPTLARRLAGHVGDFKKWNKNKEKYDFMTSFEVLREDDYYIELIELVPCSSKDELLVRERFHIQNNNCVNKNIPGRTIKEWREEHKEQIAKKAKEYAQENKEQIDEYNKKWREEHKEQIAEYNKKWCEEHKEQIKEYLNKNKEQIAEKNKEKYDCPCGSTIRKSDKSTHEKTKKHQNYLKNNMEKCGEIYGEKYCDIINADCV